MFSSFSLKLSGKLLYLLGIQLQVSLHILSGSLLITHLNQQIASSQQVLAQRSFVLSILAASRCALLLFRYLLRKSCYEQNGIHIIQIHHTYSILVTHVSPHALKGQKLLAQGIALGNYGHKLVALKGQKL
ncbi:hypothetical protein CFT61_06005 [Segatella copri]|uniref:Transmembrane protein n=1 Tax=Segatella copri TaxID=165179 RepID=A0AA91YXE6_9BACT|nr:hypothetical protein CFT61_06005 [Segatella copri]